MTLYSLTSTPSRSAVAFAVASGRTLNPMMIALDADAKITSDSLIAPTPVSYTHLDVYKRQDNTVVSP